MVELDTTNTTKPDDIENLFKTAPIVAGNLVDPDALTAAENAKAGNAPASVTTPAAVTPAPALDLEAIAKKLEAGQTLTAEEEAVVIPKIAEIENTPVEEPTYTIAGKKLTQAEAETKMREEFKLGDMPLADSKKLTETWVKAQNKTMQGLAVEERQRQVVADRKELSEKAKQIEQQKINVKLQERMLQKERNAIEEEKKRIAVLAQRTMVAADTIDIATGNTDVAKLTEYIKIEAAKEKFQELNQKGKALEDSQLVQQREYNALQVQELIEANPQYKTKEPLEKVMQNFEAGLPVDPLDLKRVIELNSLLTEAIEKGTPLSYVFEVRQNKKELVVPVTEQSVATIAPKLSPDQLPNATDANKKLAQRIRAVQEREKNNPRTLPVSSSGADRHQPPVGLTADSLIDAGHAVTKGGENQFLKTAGLV